MRFREFLIKQLIENVNQDRTTLTFQAKAINPSLTNQQINNLLTQIEKEENEKYTDKSHAEYVRSTFARKRLKELLGQTKQTKTVKEDPNVRKAKGINAKYYKWILKVNETMPMANIDRSVFDYLTANNVSPETNKSYEEVKRESDAWHKEKYEKAKSTEYKLKLDDPKYAHLIEPIRDMYMVQVTEEDQVAEGKNMKHCVGGQCKLTGLNVFYSLRDKNNEPHVTIEIDDNKVVQIKAKANEPVGLNYSSYVVDWLLKHKDIEIETLDGMKVSNKDIERLELSKRINKDLLLNLVVSSGNIERVKELINKNPTIDKNHIMALSAEHGHVDIVKLMIELGANNFNIVMYHAATNGHIDIVKLMIEHGANDFNEAMRAAAYSGYIDIVKLMIEQGANDFNQATIRAAASGQIEIVKLMIEHGYNDFNPAMLWAARNDHIDIVKLMLEHGADDFNDTMRAAARNGHIDIVKLMLEHGADDFNDTMRAAALNGYIDIVKLLIEKGFKDFNQAMYSASRHGHIEIVKLLIEHGADDFNEAMINASINGHIEIVKLMIEHGANDFKNAIYYAKENKHTALARFLQQEKDKR